MRINFTEEVIKEIRRLGRDYKHKTAFTAALTKIYEAGYDNGLKESTRKIQEVLNDNNPATNGDYVNGVGIQPQSSVIGGSQGPYTTDSDSSGGSVSPEWESSGIHPRSI